MTSCSFAKTFWFRLCQKLQHQDLTPTGQITVKDWWITTLARRRGKRQKITATMMIAGLRRIWLERNARVFEGTETNLNTLVRRVCDELALWEAARKNADRGEE